MDETIVENRLGGTRRKVLIENYRGETGALDLHPQCGLDLREEIRLRPQSKARLPPMGRDSLLADDCRHETEWESMDLPDPAFDHWY